VYTSCLLVDKSTRVVVPFGMEFIATFIDRFGVIIDVVIGSTIRRTCPFTIARMHRLGRTIFDGSPPRRGFIYIVQSVFVHGTVQEGTIIATGKFAVGDAAWSYLVSGRGVFEFGQV